MRAERLVTLLLLLESRSRMTARELAAELEVSLRTVYRDVEALSGAGVPVYGERGSSGGFRLLEGHRLQLTGLTASEAAALPFAHLPGVADELGVQAARRSALLKLTRALPAAARTAAQRTSDHVLVDVDAAGRSATGTATRRALRSAIERQRVVRIVVGGLPAEGTRDVQPLGLVRIAAGWQLVTAEAHGPATCPVDAISSVTATAGRFERPPQFALRDWWSRHGRPGASGGAAAAGADVG